MFCILKTRYANHQALTFEPQHDKSNKNSVHNAKTHISLRIHPVWSESSLCAQQVTKEPSFQLADNDYSDKTELMPRMTLSSRSAQLYEP